MGDTDDPTRARQSVLLMGHGSRDVAGAAEFGAFAERVAARLDLPLAHGFLELAEPPVVSALERLIAAGAREILAVPWLLLPAGHAKNDLPVAIQAVRRRHPHVRIRYGTPIGVQPEVLAVLADRLAECDPPSATGAAASDGATAVLLVERGSGDPEANAEVHRAARLLWEGRPGYLTVEPAFVGLTWPSVARGLARCAALGARRVIVLPYFLYTGVLVRRIGEQVAVFAADHPEIACHLARHLGQDTRLEALALRLIARARAGEAAMTCDVCQYRAPLLGHEAAAGQAQVSDSGHGLRGAPLPGEEHSHANYHGAHSHSDHREERDAP